MDTNQEPTKESTEERRPHFYKDNIDWMGSGAIGDPWVMLSWDVKRCTCDRPWRHAHGA